MHSVVVYDKIFSQNVRRFKRFNLQCDMDTCNTTVFERCSPSCQWDGFRGAFAVLDLVQKQHTTTTMNNNDDWNNKITIFFNFTQPL